MTRINLIDPSELADQHLMAEYRELLMVPAALRRSLRTKTVKDILSSVPKDFTLNTGHVRFFYDKLKYLDSRYEQLREELKGRGFNIDDSRVYDVSDLPTVFYNDYVPTKEALEIIRERIKQKISLKPNWYRYKGEKYEQCV